MLSKVHIVAIVALVSLCSIQSDAQFLEGKWSTKQNEQNTKYQCTQIKKMICQ
jgi:hypothetical protein